jgi:hypothetical protein
VTGTLSAEASACDVAQLRHQQLEQFRFSLPVAGAPLLQQLGYFAWLASHSGLGSEWPDYMLCKLLSTDELIFLNQAVRGLGDNGFRVVVGNATHKRGWVEWVRE